MAKGAALARTSGFQASSEAYRVSPCSGAAPYLPTLRGIPENPLVLASRSSARGSEEQGTCSPA